MEPICAARTQKGGVTVATIDGQRVDQSPRRAGSRKIETSPTQLKSLVAVESRALNHDCIVQALRARLPRFEIVPFANIGHWRDSQALTTPPDAIVLSLGATAIMESEATDKMKRISSTLPATPLIVLADADAPDHVLHALKHGARGYILSASSAEICAQAIALAIAGGMFVPASSMLAMHQCTATGTSQERLLAHLFTPRQAEVARALCMGKANKIIAFELNMRESTVKVHIRSIMRKLNATNRTAVAYKINSLFASGAPVGA